MQSPENNVRSLGGQYLTFMLHGQTYGIAIATVCEINRMTAISPVPQVPDYVSGVMNLRGKVIPVVDLGRRFGFEMSTPTRETCIIVTEGTSGQVGNIVDRVCGVVDLNEQHVQPPPVMHHQNQFSFVIGIGQFEDCVIILVDTAEVLASHILVNMDEIHEAMASIQRKGVANE
jgi:purine-binding chemotaxis protein CheW